MSIPQLSLWCLLLEHQAFFSFLQIQLPCATLPVRQSFCQSCFWKTQRIHDDRCNDQHGEEFHFSFTVDCRETRCFPQGHNSCCGGECHCSWENVDSSWCGSSARRIRTCGALFWDYLNLQCCWASVAECECGWVPVWLRPSVSEKIKKTWFSNLTSKMLSVERLQLLWRRVSMQTEAHFRRTHCFSLRNNCFCVKWR